MSRAIRDREEEIQTRPLETIVRECAERVLLTKRALKLNISRNNVHLYIGEALRIKEGADVVGSAHSSHPHREVGLGILTLLRLNPEYNQYLVLEIKESSKPREYTRFEGFVIGHRTTASRKRTSLGATDVEPRAFAYTKKVKPL